MCASEALIGQIWVMKAATGLISALGVCLCVWMMWGNILISPTCPWCCQNQTCNKWGLSREAVLLVLPWTPSSLCPQMPVSQVCALLLLMALISVHWAYLACSALSLLTWSLAHWPALVQATPAFSSHDESHAVCCSHTAVGALSCDTPGSFVLFDVCLVSCFLAVVFRKRYVMHPVYADHALSGISSHQPWWLIYHVIQCKMTGFLKRTQSCFMYFNYTFYQDF